MDYALTQAELYATQRDFTRARAVIGPLMTTIYSEDVRAAARRLMGGLVDLQKELERRSTSSQTAASSPRSIVVPDLNADKPPPDGSKTKFTPAYRVLQNGEQRLEGTLEPSIAPPESRPSFGRVHLRTLSSSRAGWPRWNSSRSGTT